MPVNAFMKKKDFLNIIVLILIAVVIFYPLFYTEYLYTDEAVQLWLYKKGSNFQMFLPQGRYITEKLFQWLFSKANTIHDVRFIRLFSFFGWILCIPIWYYIFKKVITRERLPELLTFFSILYLICTPPFSVYVSWASCIELFIANTAGLISGYILYWFIRYENGKIHIPIKAIVGSIFFGVISLFTYQNGFGCFLIPFLLHLIARPKSFRLIFIAIAICLLIYLVYYFLFKYNLRINKIEAVNRTEISFNIFPKVRFFFRPLATAFHFSYLFNEKSITGFIIYLIIFFAWVIMDFYRSLSLLFTNYLKFLALVLLMLVLIYLPSLIIKENYFSNRTLLALNMAVFFLTATTLLEAVKKDKVKFVIGSLSVLFIVDAWFNFNKQFLKPLKNEYSQVRAFIEDNYNPDINTVYFIRPHENFFVKTYHITRSWDEFGVPSTFFDWVPEFFVKQVVFEKTGNRPIAEKLMIKHWLGKEEFLSSNPQLSKDILLVDVEEIITGNKINK
jgi:hypothetical protein